LPRTDWFPKTLFGRTLLLIALVVATGALALAAIARYAGVAAERAYDQLLAGASIQVAENLYVQGGVLALNPPVAALSTLSRYDLVYYKVVDSRGVVVAGYGDLASPATRPPRSRGRRSRTPCTRGIACAPRPSRATCPRRARRAGRSSPLRRQRTRGSS
jgi:two-component system sensor histidine kinase TctE